MALKKHYKVYKRMARSVHILERTMRTKIMNDSFIALDAFKHSKGNSNEKSKNQANFELAFMLRDLYLTSANHGFRSLKIQSEEG